MFIPVQQNWRLHWGAQTTVGYFCHPWPVFALKFVCGILSSFMLTIVFESLVDFPFFWEKICTCTRVALIHSRVQRLAYAGCSLGQSRTVREFPLYTVAYNPGNRDFRARVYLSWFMLTIVFEGLVYFPSFWENFVPIRGFLLYTVAHRGLRTQVVL